MMSRDSALLGWTLSGKLRSAAATAVFVALPFYATLSFSEEGSTSVSASGRIQFRGVQSFEGSPREKPSLLGRVQLKLRRSHWRMLFLTEGGMDGGVNQDPRDKHVLKSFDQVYQDNTPFLDIKELYLERSFPAADLRMGVQRFAWGRLDDIPPTDLLNPLDYTQFIWRSLEERKIGVPSVALSLYRGSYTFNAIWIPWFVPYRLALPGQRWAFAVGKTDFPAMGLPVRLQLQEADLPAKRLANSTIGLRLEQSGEVEWAISVFDGYDPRPVFSTNRLRLEVLPNEVLLDPGFTPSFHRVQMFGMDAAWIMGEFSLRAEAAYIHGRHHNLRTEFWGYPSPAEVQTAVQGNLSLGETVTAFSLQPIEVKIDTVEYGIGTDYRVMEETLLTIQIQQTARVKKDARLISQQFDTILWANLRKTLLNAQWEINLGAAWNPESRGYMASVSAFYTFSDTWKAGGLLRTLGGESQSFFGSFRRNDQAEVELLYYW